MHPYMDFIIKLVLYRLSKAPFGSWISVRKRKVEGKGRKSKGITRDFKSLLFVWLRRKTTGKWA